MASGVNSIGSQNPYQQLASINRNSQPQKAAGTDADGDKDGSTAAKAASKPQNTSLTIGTRIDTTA
ncbi:hypothetical protein [Vogesella sp. LIG4]|uniref:hypothetical protein n=1 Tax=Vogesella sp. LIG4 TaxID=1192162 RepID=UPI0008200842|nr:hypothetical protein [Vogesella sp. LIG4]SCK25632.1 hypothetical protein PSELUDRAFT_3058 [Vogesella sp. LIG4]